MKFILLFGILIAALFYVAPAHAQDVCDVNPDDPSCNVEIFTVVPATADVCPYGGWQFIVFGTPYPVCNGAPGAQGPAGPPGPAGAPGASAPAGPISAPVIAPVQPPGCTSRRQLSVKLPGRFHVGERVKVTM